MDRAAIIKALRDTAQSASNTVAEGVSGPVDLIASALRAGGVPVGNPVGGSKWMAEKGLTRNVEMGAPRIIGETLGMVVPAVAAAKAPQIAAAMNQAGRNLAAPRTMNSQTGAIVWHGSPHKFDKFDSSKIGTGEGAQAYGHGLYLAESKKVADEYAGKLSKKMVSIDGFGGNDVERAILDRLSARANSTQYGGGAQAALDDLHSISRFGSQEEKAVANAMLSKIGPFGMPSVDDAGSLYKVDLPDEAIAKMLDWDKPFSQQTQQVQEFFSDYSRPPGQDTIMGEWLKPRIAEGSMIAQDLKAAGIPGIRYLDGVSRGAGSGTSNFVVFPGNESLLRILERNGQPLGLMGVK